MSHSTPLCSVVIVTWNRLDSLKKCVASVLAQSAAPNIEVIIIDNASTDGTQAWLRGQQAPQLRCFAFGSNMGASRARNAGIRLAGADKVCFLDSDACLLDPTIIAECCAELDLGTARAVTTAIWFDEEKTRPFCFGGYITPEGHFHGQRSWSDHEDPHFISTCFAVWQKDLLRELRGFDPWYFWGIEDMDLSLRATWNRRRGRTRGAAAFKVLMHLNVHHDMAREGRPYQFDDTVRVIRAIERQRLHLVASYGGVGEFLRVLVTSPLHLRRIERDAWQQRLRWRDRALALVAYPLLRLCCLPWDLLQMRRDHLSEAALPGPLGE